jgi:hypothetical protein
LLYLLWQVFNSITIPYFFSLLRTKRSNHFPFSVTNVKDE